MGLQTLWQTVLVPLSPGPGGWSFLMWFTARLSAPAVMAAWTPTCSGESLPVRGRRCWYLLDPSYPGQKHPTTTPCLHMHGILENMTFFRVILLSIFAIWQLETPDLRPKLEQMASCLCTAAFVSLPASWQDSVLMRTSRFCVLPFCLLSLLCGCLTLGLHLPTTNHTI